MFILNYADLAHKLPELLQRLVHYCDVCGESNKDRVFILDCFATTFAIFKRTCQGNITFRVDAHLGDGIVLLASKFWLF